MLQATFHPQRPPAPAPPRVHASDFADASEFTPLIRAAKPAAGRSREAASAALKHPVPAVAFIGSADQVKRIRDEWGLCGILRPTDEGFSPPLLSAVSSVDAAAYVLVGHAGPDDGGFRDFIHAYGRILTISGAAFDRIQSRRECIETIGAMLHPKPKPLRHS